ncbi:accessory Sec system protein Asp2 [Bacillus paralicheniformis]|uniref:accessory Sec system protein Asp2 n=1 Tax=Bacillus paralicheniformis TaxID=1648923 RepID=UPI001E509837|nr:accessory Sec system protein Asp2 [Bacillus paralicheniformis]MDE1391256.1 accessory Sec system protein Asp2 [Bacillus paralicheniformis]MDR9800168.1 accessory Sec system protein Asp2 [Bacillus paralicheniformis]
MVSLNRPDPMTETQLQALVKALPGSRNKDPLEAAELIVRRNAFKIPPFGITTYKEKINWKGDQSRSYLRLIHANSFLGCLLDAYLLKNNDAYLYKALDLIIDWIENNNYSETRNSMGWHDETTALRLQYWLKFYIYTKNKLDQDKIELLKNKMWETAELLSTDSFHATNTNHGMFQDISLLQFASYFKFENKEKCKEFIDLSIKRLKDYFESIFTVEGVHKEHSPSYHLLVVSQIKKLIDWMKEFDSNSFESFYDLYLKSEKYATYIIRPDGVLPPICDTEPKKVSESSYKNLYDTDEYLFSVTKGEKGRPPVANDAVFKEAGYAIFRDDWSNKEKATYCLFSAAYHVDYHKHSDDLNLYIYSNGEIITEAGPNGYNYKDPYTKYAFSSFAHNTLLVNGKGLPRTDGKYDDVFIEHYRIGQDESEATGVNRRFDEAVHKRNVKFNKKNQKIIVHDTISSDSKNEYQLLWHVARDIKVKIRDHIVEFFRDDQKVMELELFTEASPIINVHKGQTEPVYRGWVFPQMEKKYPTTTLEVNLTGRNVDCVTEFRLSSFKLPVFDETLSLEKDYFSTRELTYFFEEATEETYKKHLIVVFSDIEKEYNNTFHFKEDLNNIKTNKLFIKDDFGSQGSFFIGRNRDYSIETSVMSLINYFISKLGILQKDVAAVGLSKGGFSAIYYGIKYHFGHVITGRPPSKLGQYLIHQEPLMHIAEYIGSGYTEGDCYYLDQILYNILDQPVEASPHIKIFVGKKDNHLNNQVMPLYNILKNRGYNTQLDIKNNIDHKGLEEYFPYYMKHHLKLMLGIQSVYDINWSLEEVYITDVHAERQNNKIFVCTNAFGRDLYYAFYLYKEGVLEEKIPYSRRNNAIFNLKEKATYMIRAYVKNKSDIRVARNSNQIKID